MYQKQKQSPYHSVEYQSLQHSKQTTIKKIETVFTYFAGKASKYNFQELHEKYFTELASHLFRLAGLQRQISLRSKQWLTVTTLYYTKGRNKPLYFSQFLELLPALATTLFAQGPSSQKKATQKQRESAMKSLILLLQKIYYIIRQEEIEKKSLQAEDIVEDTKQFLLKLRESLVKLYKIYFQYETNLKDKSKDYQLRSFENFIELMKDFDVFPKLINASQLYNIYNEVLEDHEHYHLSLLAPSIATKTAFPKLGQHFTLTRMILALILASHVCVSKLKRVQGEELLFCNTGLSQKQGIKLLLEYMQTVRSVKSKMCKFSLQRFSLIVYEQYADYASKSKQSVYSSPAKTSRYNNSEEKKSFFDIMHNINI